MAEEITRRDFLNGVAIGAGTAILPSQMLGNDLPQSTYKKIDSHYYPPTLTGLRGSHQGSFEVAHALAWQGKKPDHYKALDEHYDLVVVGAGMSGLAAARYYQLKMGPKARILILDNHDDFGGHAKRNEFHHRDRMVLSLGGAQNIENLSNYSDNASNLMADLGIDDQALSRMAENTPADFALAGNFNSDQGMSFPGPDGNNITIQGSWLMFMQGQGDYKSAVRALPLPSAEQDKLIAFFGGEQDYLDELSLQEKYTYTKTVSYNQFLVERVDLSAQSMAIMNTLLRIYKGPTGWNLSILEAFAAGAPGLRGMGWLGALASSMMLNLLPNLMQVRMFPDGNASIARLLVHKLIPAVAPKTSGFNDIAVAHFDYSALDRDNQGTRLRLNSTVVGVEETKGNQVQIDYVQQGEALRVTANHCILACYNGLIPHLCPQLSDKQKEALGYGVKVPFVYANVLLDNGRAFSKLGATLLYCPEDPFSMLSSAPTTSSGGYKPPRGPEDPMAVFMMASPTPAPKGNEHIRDLYRLGRFEVYTTSFATYEQQIRDQLQALLGAHGFDHKTDIRAITVNRIPHGYAYKYSALHDPEWPEGQAPHEIGRAQFGRISIANSDAEAKPFMDAAFDAAWRAVEEQTA